MTQVFDSFLRAVAYCRFPRVIVLSFLPLLITVSGVWALGFLFWDTALASVRTALDAWSWLASALQWFNNLGIGDLRNVLAPMLVVTLSVPVIIILALLLVALLATPTLVDLVATRRFKQLERRRGASLLQSAVWSLVCTVVALLMLAASVPLWFVPPLLLIVAPLIWGWLTYRVLSFDALAEHASKPERLQIMLRHRWQLLTMGVISGYLSAAPSLVWAASALTLVLAPLLIVFSVWLYTLVFAFSSLWFAHFALAALAVLRTEEQSTAPQ